MKGTATIVLIANFVYSPNEPKASARVAESRCQPMRGEAKYAVANTYKPTAVRNS